jgi:cyclic beta-1,2-glucan synthetase
VAGLFIGALILFQPLTQPVTWATSRAGWRKISLRALGRGLLRSVVEAALLPYRAGMAVDAIVRVAHRRWVSGRHLLEWRTAQMTGWEATGRIRSFSMHMSIISLFSLLVLLAVWWLHPEDLLVAAPFIILWISSPALGVLLSRPRSVAQTALDLSSSERIRLRGIARRTWRYFDDFVGSDTHWLPPDNYQVSHQDQLAMRTSPTNIGLWLLSALAAFDLGYLTVEEMLGKIGKSAQSVAALGRYEGHLLNWYDLETLQPLEPRYVSMVDSGNLVASLWALGQGLAELEDAPVIDERALLALEDILNILLEEAQSAGTSPDSREIQALARLIRMPHQGVGDLVPRLGEIDAAAQATRAALPAHAEDGAEAEYWASQILKETQRWRRMWDTYLGWQQPLLEFLAGGGNALEAELHSSLSSLSAGSPSLADLAGRDSEWVSSMREALEAARAQIPDSAVAIRAIETALDTAQQNAEKQLNVRDRLLDWCQDTSEQINMRFLYDQRRRLFAIGFNVSLQRLDHSYYDLLASEARLGSFAAIASGQVPYEHWLALNRPFGATGGGSALLSWSGTMFEYLMPLLLQRSFENSLLDQAAHQAIKVQMRYARRRGVPWGISESAYGDLDPNKTYQYKAFGVPALGLKRGLDEDLVVAPYATLLAVPIAPSAAMRNLNALSDLGLESRYGFYEAIDFSRASRRPGERGVIVRAYMAHHQAMGLLALDNVINAEVMQARFHSDPRVKANEALLYERIPVSPPIHLVSAREQPRSPSLVEEISPAVSKFETARTANPKTQLLSNGDYSLLITAAGGGRSTWRDVDITRWRADTTRDHWGTFCYLRDADSQAVWSTAHHPTGSEGRDYHVSFAIDRAEISRSDNGIAAESEIIISPEDDVEIRRITLTNRSLRNRTIQLTSYIELAMAPHASDLQHPAFSKLFVETESVPELDALISWRRARGPDDASVFAGHVLSFEDQSADLSGYETDRRAFIGRGRTLANPAVLEGEMGNSQGFVLDPIFSLRGEVSLRPGGRTRFSLILAVSEEREALLALLRKYRDAHAIERAFEFAWAQAQLELRQLRIQPDDARRFQKMASFMVYPHPQFRPPPERLQANTKDQSGLWPYGISGDLPIALVSISEARDLTLVRQMLQAHTYWRHHGLKADLVILNEESSAYEQPLNEQLSQMIQAHSTYTGIDIPGGVFLRVADQIPEGDLNLMLSVARISLVAARGSLAQQLGTPREDLDLPPLKERRSISRDPSPRLSYIALSQNNGLGGFTQDEGEYVIYLGPERHTPAPWSNVISNAQFGTLVTESGPGFSWYGNSQRNRLTPWSNDSVSDQAHEAVYIRDEESGEFWTPTPLPIRERAAYRIRHAPGYSMFEHNSNGIEAELLIFVPVDEGGGDPLRVQRLRLRNDSREARLLTVTHYLEWVLGEERESTQMHVFTAWDPDSHALLARNRYNPDYGNQIAFAAIFPEATAYTGDRTAFLGRNGHPQAPEAMLREGLTGRVGAGLDPCAALQTRLELGPGQEREVIMILGQASSPDQARGFIQKYSEGLAVEAHFKRTRAWWDRFLGSLQVDVPDSGVNVLLNRWLLYQNLSCRVWGRSAFYQSGGAYGFRDQLQDVMALLYASPEVAREHILRAAQRQFVEGDVQHWWHPPSGAGVRTRISDDLLWLPYGVSRYVLVTGDVSILDQRLPFLMGPELGEEEQEAFSVPEESVERASLYEHCRRAIERASTAGPHGLPLIGAGDWNDGLNRVGAEGKGESVWLAFFMIDVLRSFADTAERFGRQEHADDLRSRAERLDRVVDREAWDGEWYLRAYFDDGSPLGSAENREAKIDLLPQSWSVLSGAGDPERNRRALQAADEQLVREGQGTILLFTPPFDQTDRDPGYIKGYPPGVRENGGQYTHGAIWFAMAFARLGEGDRAARLLHMLNPLGHALDPEGTQRYRVEPYVLAGDVYDLTSRKGMGGWTWYTGSAGWYYRAWIEEVLGFQLRGDELRIDPAIPRTWEKFELRYCHGDAVYEILVENPEAVSTGVRRVSVDGERMETDFIQLERERIKHRVKVRMG